MLHSITVKISCHCQNTQNVCLLVKLTKFSKKRVNTPKINRNFNFNDRKTKKSCDKLPQLHFHSKTVLQKMPTRILCPEEQIMLNHHADLQPHQEELQQLAELAGIHMDSKVFR